MKGACVVLPFCEFCIFGLFGSRANASSQASDFDMGSSTTMVASRVLFSRGVRLRTKCDEYTTCFDGDWRKLSGNGFHQGFFVTAFLTVPSLFPPSILVPPLIAPQHRTRLLFPPPRHASHHSAPRHTMSYSTAATLASCVRWDEGSTGHGVTTRRLAERQDGRRWHAHALFGQRWRTHR